MVTVDIRRTPKFDAVGVKTWISGTDSSQFGEFWREQGQNGNLERLRAYGKRSDQAIGARFIGVSDTAKDPNLREFFFYVAVEADPSLPIRDSGIERISVGEYAWAVFSEGLVGVESLLACEMHCWTEWLPGNGHYEHDFGPEMEAYFDDRVEYWIPIREKRPGA